MACAFCGEPRTTATLYQQLFGQLSVESVAERAGKRAQIFLMHQRRIHLVQFHLPLHLFIFFFLPSTKGWVSKYKEKLQHALKYIQSVQLAIYEYRLKTEWLVAGFEEVCSGSTEDVRRRKVKTKALHLRILAKWSQQVEQLAEEESSKEKSMIRPKIPIILSMTLKSCLYKAITLVASLLNVIFQVFGGLNSNL